MSVELQLQWILELQFVGMEEKFRVKFEMMETLLHSMADQVIAQLLSMDILEEVEEVFQI